MDSHRTPLQWFLSRDANIHRLLRYWALGMALYGVSLSMLWFEVWLEVAPLREAIWLSAASITGAAAAFVAIRVSGRYRLPSAWLNTAQCLHAMTCIVASYALVGPMRGVTLSILVVVLVFGGFSSTAGQVRAVCLYTILLLGATMAWKSQTDPARYPAQEELVHFVLGFAMLIAVAYLAQLLSKLRRKLKVKSKDLADALTRIQDLATRDELTGLINRRQMTEILALDEARRQRHGESACIALIDIDHFKQVNDTLGHGVGDEVLIRFASHALAAVRVSDVLARWGGEEFLLLLPATNLGEAKMVLERMRQRVRESVRIDADPSLRITFSAGLVEAPADQFVVTAIERADEAMYSAKRAGRDRIACVWNCAPTGMVRTSRIST